MVSPDDLYLMNEQEKLDLISEFSEAEGWRECFEPICVRLMDDESPQVRQAAIVALWDLADPRHIEPLMKKAESDPDTEVRGKATSVLGIYIYEAVVNGGLDEGKYLAVRKFLLDLAQNPDEAFIVRRMAIEALSFDPDEAVQDLIDWAYRHSLIEVRMTAVFAMGRSQSPRWHEMILEELGSKERQLRLEAVNAAAEAELAGATPMLRNLATCSDKEIRIAALWALPHTRGPGAIETLEMCALAEDEEVRRMAEEAIEEFHSIGDAMSHMDDDDDEDDE